MAVMPKGKPSLFEVEGGAARYAPWSRDSAWIAAESAAQLRVAQEP